MTGPLVPVRVIIGMRRFSVGYFSRIGCFKKGLKVGALCLGLSISISTGVAQNTPAASESAPSAQPGQGEQSVTPEQQREKEIQKYDPLYRSNPALDRDDSDRNSSGSSASVATQVPAPPSPANSSSRFDRRGESGDSGQSPP